MNDAFDLRSGETHIEVHKFRGGTILFATIFALLVQAFLPVYWPKVATLDLPLLITIYFGLSRRKILYDTANSGEYWKPCTFKHARRGDDHRCYHGNAYESRYCYS